MAEGLVLQLTHTGLHPGSLYLSDVQLPQDGERRLTSQGLYIPANGSLTLPYGMFVAQSLETGVISKMVTNGWVTASFVVGNSVRKGLNAGTVQVVTVTPTVVSAASSLVLTNLTVPGAVALTLPAGAAHQIGLITFKDFRGDAGANNITITPAVGQTIDGGPNLILGANKAAVTLRFYQGDWIIL